MTSPAITGIVLLRVDFTPKGVLVMLDVTYKGGTTAIATIRVSNIIEVAKLSKPIGDIITKRGFARGA